EVGQNDVGTKLFEGRAELALIGHGARETRDAAGSEMPDRELGLGGGILHDEQAQSLCGGNGLPCRGRRGTIPRSSGIPLPLAFSGGSQLSLSDNVVSHMIQEWPPRCRAPVRRLCLLRHSSPIARKSRPSDRNLR